MNKTDLINKIIAGYAADLNARRAAIAARLQLERANPDFAAIERTLNDLYIEHARCRHSDLLPKIASLEKQYADYLKTHNIDTEIKYACPKCKDTGWTGGVLCACVRQRLHDELTAASGLTFAPDDFKDADMNVFPVTIREERERLYTLMKTYCQKFPDAKYRNLFFSGGVGSGKTFLASCMANEILQRGETVQFLTAFTFGSQCLKIHTADLGEREDLLAPLLDPALLILDDLGTEPILNNVTVEYLYLVLNERLTAGKHTILTTNLSPADFLARYGSRVFSRALDRRSTYAVQFDGPDLRLTNGKRKTENGKI
ncbi:hypothetical protein FACS1894211_11090 [Clostridia bacterium]|nr:hypothetical protein FACS1894211_11090 [Clostridia bacterium]